MWVSVCNAEDGELLLMVLMLLLMLVLVLVLFLLLLSTVGFQR